MTIKSYKSNYDSLIHLNNYASSLLNTLKLENSSSKTLDEQMITETLIKELDLIIDPTKIGGKMINIVYIFDYDLKIYVPIHHRIGRILTHLGKVIKTPDMIKLERGVLYRLSNESPESGDIPVANFPPYWILKFKNGYYNTKTKEFREELGDYSKFHFNKFIAFDYLTADKYNPMYISIVNRIFDAWSDNEEENKKYLFQILLAAMEGFGRHKVHIIKSAGGDGKSAFLRIIRNLAGSDHVVEANLHELNDDNILNQFNEGTKASLGDDLGTNSKLIGSALSRFKSLSIGEALQVKVKYKDNMVVKFKGTMVQATNTDVSFYENSDAIKDRILVFDWPSVNYRRNPVTEYNVDELTGKAPYKVNDEFYENLIAIVLNEITSFERFDVPDSIIKRGEQMVNDNDPIYHFVQHLNDTGLLDWEMIQVKPAYEYYKIWLKEENPSSGAVSLTKFTNKFGEIMTSFGFILEDNRAHIGATSPLRFNHDVFKKFTSSSVNYNKSSSTRACINSENKISEKQLKEYKESFLNNNYTQSEVEQSPLLSLIVEYLIKVDNDLDIMVWMGE